MTYFYRSERENYKSYPNSYLQPFEKENIEKAIGLGLMSSVAAEIISQFESEEGNITEDNYENIYSKDYYDDSMFYLKACKLVFTSASDARRYGKEINCLGEYIVSYTGKSAVHMGTEPDSGMKVYALISPEEISVEII